MKNKLMVCRFDSNTLIYGNGDVILDNSTGKYFYKDCVRMSEHGDWFVDDLSNEVDPSLVDILEKHESISRITDARGEA